MEDAPICRSIHRHYYYYVDRYHHHTDHTTCHVGPSIHTTFPFANGPFTNTSSRTNTSRTPKSK